MAGTLPKFNSSPLKSYQNPIGKDRLPLPPLFRGELLNFGGVTITYQQEMPMEITNRNDSKYFWISPPRKSASKAPFKIHSLKTNMRHGKSTMNEDVVPVENGDFPASHVSFQIDLLYTVLPTSLGLIGRASYEISWTFYQLLSFLWLWLGGSSQFVSD